MTFVVAALAVTALAEAAPGPSRHKTLFLDDHHVAEMTDLRRVMHTPAAAWCLQSAARDERRVVVLLHRHEAEQVGPMSEATTVRQWDER